MHFPKHSISILKSIVFKFGTSIVKDWTGCSYCEGQISFVSFCCVGDETVKKIPLIQPLSVIKFNVDR